MPEVPKQGAEMIGDLENLFTLEPIMGVVTAHVAKLDYPVKGDRKLALQEAETVCCVFKQHVVGDYKFGFRSAKAYTRLLTVRNETPTAIKLLDGLYAGGIWTPKNLGEIAL
jgi:hypothetical protein